MPELISKTDKPTLWIKTWWFISLQWDKLTEEQRQNVIVAMTTQEKPKPSDS